jgi:hypothetical protein
MVDLHINAKQAAYTAGKSNPDINKDVIDEEGYQEGKKLAYELLKDNYAAIERVKQDHLSTVMSGRRDAFHRGYMAAYKDNDLQTGRDGIEENHKKQQADTACQQYSSVEEKKYE